MDPETSQRLCGNDAMFERKGDIVLPRKIILKIQLIENKEVTLFVQLNW